MTFLTFFVRQLIVKVADVLPIKQDSAHLGAFENVLQEATAANSEHRLDVAGPTGDRGLQSSRPTTHLDHREVRFVKAFFRVSGLVVDLAAGAVAVITINIDITGPSEALFEFETTMEVGYDGTGIAETDIGDEFLNDDKTGVCVGCRGKAIAGDCISGTCAGYDKDASNTVRAATVSRRGWECHDDFPRTPYIFLRPRMSKNMVQQCHRFQYEPLRAILSRSPAAKTNPRYLR